MNGRRHRRPWAPAIGLHHRRGSAARHAQGISASIRSSLPDPSPSFGSSESNGRNGQSSGHSSRALDVREGRQELFVAGSKLSLPSTLSSRHSACYQGELSAISINSEVRPAGDHRTVPASGFSGSCRSHPRELHRRRSRHPGSTILRLFLHRRRATAHP